MDPSIMKKQFFPYAKQFHAKRKLNEISHDYHKKSKPEEMKDVLPIYFGKKALLNEIRMNECIVLMSETGSGKTTQLPQYLLASELVKRGVICCTQPRRVAAISVAKRVSEEMCVELGSTVGYAVRFEDTTSSNTKLKYMTDGLLLREALLDPLLKQYSIIILDEAHERSVQTDVLFGVVKKAQKERRCSCPLKVIIMSATLNADSFSKYFHEAKVCFLEGRRYPIKIFYTEDEQKDYSHTALVTALQLHREKPLNHDILLFLTGQEEIDSLARIMLDISKSVKEDYDNLLVQRLYASLPNDAQMKVFEKTPTGYRKIILSTNIAETSLTIPGVKYVVDCGMVKAKVYNSATGLDHLKVQPISKAQARQRCGRAGRESSGECFRLYTEAAFSSLRENTIPEIQRCNLRNITLNLLCIGLKDVLKFDFMSPPADGSLIDALRQLVMLGAVESVETQKVTEKGKLMASFPLDPTLTACILAADDLGCTEELITIVALMSVENLMYVPPNQREKCRQIMRKFESTEGDQVTMFLYFRAYKQSKGSAEWCRQHFANYRNMLTVLKIRKQLRDICQRSNIRLVSCHNNYSVIRKALAFGLFMNSAERQNDGSYVTIVQKQQVHIHPSSVLFQAKPSTVVYNELVETSKRYMRFLCVVDPTWLHQACPNCFETHRILPLSVSS